MEKNQAQARNDVRRGTPPLVWALSDGRAGNAAMAMGVAERLAEQLDGVAEARTWSPPRPWLWLPPSALWTLSGRGTLWPLAQMTPMARMTQGESPYPQAVIGAGRRAAVLAGAIKAQRPETIVAQILNPRMDLAAFDWVIAPEHDGLIASNVIATLGAPHRMRPGISSDPGPRRAELEAMRRPLIAALIGGSTRRWRMTATDGAAAGAALLQLAEQAGGAVAVTPSRRTPAAALAALREALAPLGDRAWVWDGTSANPYRDMLATADAFAATGDSVTMASEAASTGKPLFLLPTGDPSPRLAAFAATLRTRGIARAAADGWGTWAYAPLDEAGRAAEIIAARMTRI